MQTITLTTDWGLDGIYVGAFKGRLLSETNSINFVDISHHISPFDIGQAAFTLRTCYTLFPKGTIHILGVGGEINRKMPTNRNYVVFEKDEYFFLGNDDGSWKLIFDELPQKVYCLSSSPAIETYMGFPELGIFISAIMRIIENSKLADFAKPYEFKFQYQQGMAAIHPSMINGEIIYFDNYGNAITNITKNEFERVCKGRNFEIYVGSYHNKYKITKINKEYTESISGNLLAIFSYSGFLEIAIANGKATELLNVRQNKEIRIQFTEKKEAQNTGTLF